MITITAISFGVYYYYYYEKIFNNEEKKITNAERKISLDSLENAVQVKVLNGCGVQSVSKTLMSYLRKNGYDVVEIGNYKNFDVEKTFIIDRVGDTIITQKIAKEIGIDTKKIKYEKSRWEFVTASVVIGKDYNTLPPWK